MFTRPAELADSDVASALFQGWGLELDEFAYVPVGFGSHHWAGRTRAARWFVTVDDLDARRVDTTDPRSETHRRLTVALQTARMLRDAGSEFVIAPTPSASGEVVEPIDERFVCALYPHVEGRAGEWGHYDDDGERRAVTALLAGLHRASAAIDLPTLVDDYTIPARGALREAIDDVDGPWTAGPFAESARSLLAKHRGALQEVLARYDELVRVIDLRAPQRVVTHGEPHRGNVIITGSGPVLIDWDTALVAPVERDLWSLVAEDPSVRDVYETLTGTSLDDDALTLYRLWWDLCEVALYIDQFRRPHDRSDDTAVAWSGLVTHLDPSRWNDPPGRRV